ncbi:unnamed protein product [Prunus armeniaca]
MASRRLWLCKASSFRHRWPRLSDGAEFQQPLDPRSSDGAKQARCSVSRLFWEAWDSWTPPRVAMFWSWEGFDSSAKDENARKGKKTKRLSCINRRKEEEEDNFDFNFAGGHL